MTLLFVTVVVVMIALSVGQLEERGKKVCIRFITKQNDYYSLKE